MRKWYFAFAVTLVGCSGSQQAAEPPDVPLTPHEAEWVSYRDQYALPNHVNYLIDLMPLMHDKVAAQGGISQYYTDMLNGTELTEHAAANFGLGRLNLNLACELLTIDASEERRKSALFKNSVAVPAQRLLALARERFTAASKMEGGEVSVVASQVVSAMNASDVELCEATKPHWAAASRPEPPPVTVERCLARVRESASLTIAEPCLSEIDATCLERHDVDACLIVAEHWWNEGAAAKAAQRWDRACGEGDARACHARNLSTELTSRDEDARACGAEKDVVACFRAATARPVELVDHCTGSSVPAAPTRTTQQRCNSGDAMACWGILGGLLDAGAQFPVAQSAILGALGGGGIGMGFSGTPDFEAQCASGDASACRREGDRRKGRDALEWYERACSLAPAFNCSVYGNALLNLGDKVDEATQLLVEACDQRGEACYRIAKRFRDGDGVPQSNACAAALGLKYCNPIDSCGLVNTVFSSPDEED